MAKISRLSIPAGCISLKGFDPVVRYGTGYPNLGSETQHQGEPFPNAPYATCPLPTLPTLALVKEVDL
ncbi:MAG: hypothetical protein F6K56_33320 [Moorea sp. SIO3G5]|nr:hypothetical protein [Moorena sp. SIO3G5]